MAVEWQLPRLADHPLCSTDDLAELCGGDPTGFMGTLLYACCKADRGNLARLREGFPAVVVLYEVWSTSDPDAGQPPTARDLAARYLEVLQERSWRGGPLSIVERHMIEDMWGPLLGRRPFRDVLEDVLRSQPGRGGT